MQKIYALLFLAFVLLPLRLPAQQLRTIHYTVDEGLPSNELYDVHEDALGYLWLASDQGLIRFDGSEFDVFTIQDGLVTNTIFSVKPDHRGFLWMRGIDGSLCMYANGVFRPFPFNDQLRECLGARFIEDFHWTRDGRLYFSSSGRPQELFVWEPETKMAHALHLPPGKNLAVLHEQGRPVFAHLQDTGRHAQADTLLPAGWMTAHVETGSDLTPHVYLQALPDSSAVIGVLESVFYWKKGQIVQQLDPIEGRKGFSYDREGNVLISAKSGVWKWKPGSAAPTLFLQSDVPCTKMIQDRNGNYCLATHNGIRIVPQLLLHTLDGEEGADFGTLRSLVRSSKGLYSLSSNPARLYLLPYGPDGTPSDRLTLIYRLQVHFFHDFALGQGEKVLYGTGLIHAKQKLSDKTEVHLTGVDEIITIHDLHVAGDEVLYANKMGWIRADSAGQPFYQSKDHGFKEWCTAIGKDTKGRIWIGTRDQLMYSDGGPTRPFRPGDDLFHCRITAIQAGPHGWVAVSTRGNGVILIKDGRYWQLDQRLGLPSDHCGNLCWGRRGLWIATNQGLALLHRGGENGWSKVKVQVFTTKMGLSSQMIYDVLEVKEQVFVATAKGLNWFPLRAVDAPRFALPVRIHRATVDGRALAPGARLAWHARQITFDYGAARLLAAPIAKYRYRLHGHDPIWRTSDARSVSYFGLPAGAYRFEVGSCFADGRWDTVTSTFAFEVAPHFSQMAWFRGLAGAAGLLAVFGAGYWRIRARRRRHEQAVRLQLAEIKALRAQMKPHFMFNALNAIQHYILQGDRQAGAQYLSQFAALSRRVMAQSDRSSITVAEELETLRLYIELERMRFDQAFTYDIHVADESLLEAEIPPMLIQPFVENAILHGLLHQVVDPRLLISLKALDKGHEWRIVDNGLGRAAAAQRASQSPVHASSALSNIAERIALLNGLGLYKIIFKTEDRQPTGTEVLVSFYWDSYLPGA